MEAAYRALMDASIAFEHREFARLREGADSMKLVMIDNYDSFTFNIVQYFGELGAEVECLPQRRNHLGRRLPRASPTAW